MLLFENKLLLISDTTSFRKPVIMITKRKVSYCFNCIVVLVACSSLTFWNLSHYLTTAIKGLVLGKTWYGLFYVIELLPALKVSSCPKGQRRGRSWQLTASLSGFRDYSLIAFKDHEVVLLLLVILCAKCARSGKVLSLHVLTTAGHAGRERRQPWMLPLL